MDKYKKDIGQAEFEEIERYLLGDMDTAEREAFEVRLSTDQMLRNEVVLQRQLMVTVETGTLAAKNKATQHIQVPTPIRKLTSYRKYAAAIVFIVVLGLFGWWYYVTETDNDLYTAYFRPDLGLPVVMSSDSTNYLFNEGMVSYKEGNYRDASQIWKALIDKNGVTDTLNYYVGVAYMNMEHQTEAVEYLITIAENEQSVFREKAIWYLALLKLKENEYMEAKRLLKQLPEKKEAIEILEKISDESS